MILDTYDQVFVTFLSKGDKSLVVSFVVHIHSYI